MEQTIWRIKDCNYSSIFILNKIQQSPLSFSTILFTVCVSVRTCVKQKPSLDSLNINGEVFLRRWGPSEPKGRSTVRSAACGRHWNCTADFVIPPRPAGWFFFFFFFSSSLHVHLQEKEQSYLVCSVSVFFSLCRCLSSPPPHPHHCVHRLLRRELLNKGDRRKQCGHSITWRPEWVYS